MENKKTLNYLKSVERFIQENLIDKGDDSALMKVREADLIFIKNAISTLEQQDNLKNEINTAYLVGYEDGRQGNKCDYGKLEV